MKISKPHVDAFVYELQLYDLVKEKTYFKSVHNTSFIDLIKKFSPIDQIFINWFRQC